MDWIIEEGYAFYWATSEWSADMVKRAIEICKRLKLHKPIADQCQYNALTRENAEKNFRELYEDYRYGTTVWSPLAGGLLSGKYNDGNIPEGSRFQLSKQQDIIYKGYLGEDSKEETLKALRELGEIAEELGCTQSQLVLAWTIVNKDISTCIFGATKVSQVEDNIKAMEVAAKWTKGLEERIDKILGNTPTQVTDFANYRPFSGRREIQVDYNMKPEGGNKLIEEIKKHSSK
jgi:aryl-alcohol dehydrogenase-like predicted oxidoreductase